jgi:hypothetical protein
MAMHLNMTGIAIKWICMVRVKKEGLFGTYFLLLSESQDARHLLIQNHHHAHDMWSVGK